MPQPSIRQETINKKYVPTNIEHPGVRPPPFGPEIRPGHFLSGCETTFLLDVTDVCDIF